MPAADVSFFFCGQCTRRGSIPDICWGRCGRNAGPQFSDQVGQALEIVELRDPHEGQFGERAGLRAESQSPQRLLDDLQNGKNRFQPQLPSRGRDLRLAAGIGVEKVFGPAAGRRRHDIAKIAQQLVEQLPDIDAFR